MKVAILTDHVPSRTGHSVNTVKHAQGFHDLGHEVFILTHKRYSEAFHWKGIDVHEFYGIDPAIKIFKFLDISPSYFQDVPLIGPALAMFTKQSVEGCHRFREIVDPGRRHSKLDESKVFTTFNSAKRMVNTCLKLGVDLVYSRRSPIAAYYSVKRGIDTVVESHYFVFPPYMRNLFRISRNKHFRALNTISRVLKHRHMLAGVPPWKINVLEDAVDISKFGAITKNKDALREELGLPTEKKLILYVGVLEEGRGIETILEAAKLLGQECEFVVIGGPENPAQLGKAVKRMLKRARVGERHAPVEFLGYRPHHQIPAYLKAADVLLAPYSARCSTAGWMSPIKIFEYMASGTPFVASDLKRLREICRSGECLFFKPDDPVDLSRCIEELLNSPKLGLELSSRASRTIQKFTYSERCRRILEFLSNSTFH